MSQNNIPAYLHLNSFWVSLTCCHRLLYFVMHSSIVINFPNKFIFRFTTNCISYALTPSIMKTVCTFIVHEYVSLLVSPFIVLHPDAFCLGDFLYVLRWLINWRLYNHSTSMEFYSNWSLSITFIFFRAYKKKL